MRWPPLPERVQQLLATLHAPPRLVAHLTLVHDVACAIVARIDAMWPEIAYDRSLVVLGAATHDIGKIAHPTELTQPGHEHELAGPALLQDHGFTAAEARFAQTHGRWRDDAAPPIEDLLVAWADDLWRGARDAALEAALGQRIAKQTGVPAWQIFATLDDIAADITRDADARLHWQNQHGATYTN